MNITMVKGLFVIAALYDGILGLLFLFFPGLAFEMFEVVPPNHFGYVQFSAILLLIFAAMFFRISRDPIANRFMMLYGVALKTGYSGLVFYYMLTTGVPAMWVPWAWADLAFLVVFLICWNYTGRIAKAPAD
ncbi:MAG: hypothetical protein OEU90_07685 [Gammaproteobacteria bacterium]|jgi:hypothetical protein|nr:hypothetical protein [Gammaproteobacteria bacterium]MDH3750224.1 hypothetical protein [Gammaproteobacteria bacterium]MDH3805336.1 hypothetical protein [Gammaproteobacteria bacterium]